MTAKREELKSKSGQAIIFLIVVVVILAFVMLWNFDLHKTLFVKVVARDAGDAAALAAARWQGKTLNLVGELNIVQAALLSEGLAAGRTNFPEVAAIEELRTRLNFVGPMVAFVAAEQAAKNNGVFNNARFSEELYRHAEMVLAEYPIRYAPPYINFDSDRTAWDDYAEMLFTIADHGMPVMITNPYLYMDYRSQANNLLNPEFYNAVASRNWCWFYYHARALLNHYTSWAYWPALPELEPRPATDAEFFSLKLRQIGVLARLPVLNPGNDDNRIDEWRAILRDRADENVDTDVIEFYARWHIYDASAWSSWRDYIAEYFPFETPIKDEYNVLGADVALKLNVEADRLSPGMSRDRVEWTTAAKPFGTLPGPVPIDTYGMVIPGFSDVRLIPVDTSTAPSQGSREGWGVHIYEHLPAYEARGPSALDPNCWYCRQLLQWEVYEFRLSGVEWLAKYSHTCHRPSGPGGRDGGGTRHGH